MFDRSARSVIVAEIQADAFSQEHILSLASGHGKPAPVLVG